MVKPTLVLASIPARQLELDILDIFDMLAYYMPYNLVIIYYSDACGRAAPAVAAA